MSQYYNEEGETFVRTLSQFRKAFHQHVEAYLHETFRWTTVEEWIDSVLKRTVEDIAMTALGYEKDGWHNEWKLRVGRENEGSVQTIINTMALKQAQELLPAFIEAKKEVIDKRLGTPKFKKDMLNRYNNALNDAIHSELDTWITQNATPVVKELFAHHVDEYDDQIKLKCPLTLDSLELIAKGE